MTAATYLFQRREPLRCGELYVPLQMRGTGRAYLFTDNTIIQILSEEGLQILLLIVV